MASLSKGRVLALLVLLAAVVAAGAAIDRARRTSMVRIRYAGRPPYDDLRLVSVRLDDGGRLRVVSGDTLTAAGDGATFHTRTRGTFKLDVVIAAPDTLAAARVTLPLRRDAVWDFYAFAGTPDSLFPPRRGRGTSGRVAVPIRPPRGGSERDSLWIVWGTKSISSPAVTANPVSETRLTALRRAPGGSGRAPARQDLTARSTGR